MASSPMAARLAKYFRTSLSSTPTSSSFVGLRGLSSKFYSTTTGPFGSSENDEIEDDNVDVKNNNNGGGGGGGDEIEEDDFLPEKPELELQSVDPRRGWGFRGVHKAIICGKIGRAPVQKILRNGKTVTIFTVGTGGMYDQRILGSNDLPKPAQWHRIAVHNEMLGAYAVQQLAKNSSVYVEGDIETRVYNDSINGLVKNIPEVCVRRDGRIRLIKSGESVSSISFDELREGLL